MLYNIALFAHIIGVLGIFMCVAIEFISLSGLRRARLMEHVRVWTGAHKVIAWGFPLASLLVLSAGVFMAWSAWGWNVPWIDVSFFALITIALLGRFVNGSRNRKLHHAIGEHTSGPVSTELLPLLNDRVLWFSTLMMTAVGLGVVFLMTTKPDLLGSCLVLATAIVIGLGATYVLGNRSSGGKTNPIQHPQEMAQNS